MRGNQSILADFSKAFDTVAYETVLKKMHKVGFSKSYLRWVTSYLTERKQFVQIDDKLWSTIEVAFGVPQGSKLGPVIFNLYVNDLSDSLEASVTSHQNTDDTTIYAHRKPANIKINLRLNPDKTKVMLFSTQQLARVHKLDEYPINLHTNSAKLERIKTTRLLGTEIDENLKWNDDILSKISKCYNTLAVIKKLKNLTPFHARKRLAESLVLSLIDFNDIVCHPIPRYLTQWLQRTQLATASFVYNHYADMSDVLKLGWLPISYRRDYRITRMICKALYQNCQPTCLKLVEHRPARALRSSRERRLEPSTVPGTLQNSAI